jgi:geranylgeranyl diphosphate synthase type I
VAESKRLVDLVQERVDRFLVTQEHSLTAISEDLLPFVGLSRSLLQGGKRFRALFGYWGWRAVAESQDDLPSVVDAASALELFHAAALVHDDIIDNSDTRRGLPAAHRQFEKVHSDSGWRGDPTEFGRSGALLLGDLLLGWSDELLDHGLRALGDVGRAEAARGEFNRMRTEVTYGQYLDVLEERSWHTRAEADLLSRAQRVIVYKSAKYSVEAPLAIGAAMGGASLDQLSALREFGLPLGIAYQLRDDLLGVFGDPELTGKPSGDDLREGKRTVLVAIARTRLPGNSARLLDELLGDPELSDHQVRVLQASITQSGAVDQVERVIAHNADKARSALASAPITADARAELSTLIETVSRRNA